MEGVLSSSQVSGCAGTQEQRNYDSLEALGLQPCPAFPFSRAWMDNTKPYFSPVLDFLGPYGKRAEG